MCFYALCFLEAGCLTSDVSASEQVLLMPCRCTSDVRALTHFLVLVCAVVHAHACIFVNNWRLCVCVCSEGEEGPILYGTKPDEVRFHDDKSTYTGVHKMGGPTTVDEGRVQFNDLSNFCDRSDYDIRGVKKGVMEQKTGESK